MKPERTKEEILRTRLSEMNVARGDGPISDEEWADIKKDEPISFFMDVMEEYRQSSPVESKWVRFGDGKPKIGQHILITWPSGKYPPETRFWNKEMDAEDWSEMLWSPIPKHPELPPIEEPKEKI